MEPAVGRSRIALESMLARRYFVGEVARERRPLTRFRAEATRTGRAVNIGVRRDALASCDLRHIRMARPATG